METGTLPPCPRPRGRPLPVSSVEAIRTMVSSYLLRPRRSLYTAVADMVRARTGRKDLGGRDTRPHRPRLLDGRSSTITAAVTLREQEVASVSLANGPGEAESGIDDADALLIGPAGFEALWSDDPFLFAATARRYRLLAVLEPAELLEIADL